MLIALGMVATGLILPQAVRASTAACQTSSAPPDPGSVYNELNGVAAVSSRNVWAVGSYYNGTSVLHTLVEHWNGKAWKVQASPSPGRQHFGGQLFGLAATSARNAWAVGSYSYNGGGGERTLVEHWNGKAWKIQASPNSGYTSVLLSVAATSARDAWAVGYYSEANSPPKQILIEHWDGKAWTIEPSLNPGEPGGNDQLSGVAAISFRNAWAVGYDSSYATGAPQTLIEHWNGTAWEVQASPNPGEGGQLLGVAATTARNAWAVGSFSKRGVGDRTLIEHWNGNAWMLQASPSLGHGDQLSGVAAISSRNAWAVGYFDRHADPYSGPYGPRNLIEHWNGKAWTIQATPNPAGSRSDNQLVGVATSSSINTWGVGYGTSRIFALHCG